MGPRTLHCTQTVTDVKSCTRTHAPQAPVGPGSIQGMFPGDVVPVLEGSWAAGWETMRRGQMGTRDRF